MYKPLAKTIFLYLKSLTIHLELRLYLQCSVNSVFSFTIYLSRYISKVSIFVHKSKYAGKKIGPNYLVLKNYQENIYSVTQLLCPAVYK